MLNCVGNIDEGKRKIKLLKTIKNFFSGAIFAKLFLDFLVMFEEVNICMLNF